MYSHVFASYHINMYIHTYMCSISLSHRSSSSFSWQGASWREPWSPRCCCNYFAAVIFNWSNLEDCFEVTQSSGEYRKLQPPTSSFMIFYDILWYLWRWLRWRWLVKLPGECFMMFHGVQRNSSQTSPAQESWCLLLMTAFGDALRLQTIGNLESNISFFNHTRI